MNCDDKIDLIAEDVKDRVSKLLDYADFEYEASVIADAIRSYKENRG
jgi:hypothetical protein